MKKTSNYKSNFLRLETINLTVKNLGESLYFMTNILGFKFIRSEVGEYGVKSFLESNSYDSQKSIIFCLEQKFYGEYKATIRFGLKPINKTYPESLYSLNQNGIGLKHFSYDIERGISCGYEFTEFVDCELENFVVENIRHEDVRIAHLLNLEIQHPFTNENGEEFDEFYSDDKNTQFLDSYLKEIRIKVNSLEPYQVAFSHLGFNVLPIELGRSDVRNMQIVLNEQCNINLRLIETDECLKNLNIMDYLSFKIVSNSYCEGVGSTFIKLSDIGYCFSNEVFDEEDNVITDHAEFVTPDGINWRITEK